MKAKLDIPSKEKASPLLVVGSVAYDDIVTPYMTGDRILGGAAAFASMSASYFTDVRLCGVVGEDFKEDDMRRLKERGIDLTGLEVMKGQKTFYWKGEYFENFNDRRTLELELNAFKHFKPNLPTGYKDTPYVLLGNIDPEIQHSVLKQVNKKSFVVVDTIDFWIETKREALLNLLKEVDLFTMNLEEAHLLTGETNPYIAGEKIMEMGPKTFILKKGSHGAILFHKEGMFMLPAYPITELRDPTGAGDAFAGALLGYLAAVQDHSFKSIKHAMLYATAAASLTVQDFSCNYIESAGCQAIQDRHDELVTFITV